MAKLLLLISLVLVGCGEYKVEIKCIDGHLYRKTSDTTYWVQYGNATRECRVVEEDK